MTVSISSLLLQQLVGVALNVMHFAVKLENVRAHRNDVIEVDVRQKLMITVGKRKRGKDPSIPDTMK